MGNIKTQQKNGNPAHCQIVKTEKVNALELYGILNSPRPGLLYLPQQTTILLYGKELFVWKN